MVLTYPVFSCYDLLWEGSCLLFWSHSYRHKAEMQRSQTTTVLLKLNQPTSQPHQQILKWQIWAMNHPFLFLFLFTQRRFGQVHAGQREGEGAALWGCCSQGSITWASRTYVWCHSVILHLCSSASFRPMFIHNLLLLFSTFGVSLQDKAIFCGWILCSAWRFVSHHVARVQAIVKNVWWKINT